MIGPGKNIAIDVPLHERQETAAFYRDRAGLRAIRQSADTAAFGFGTMTPCIDRVEKQSQVDVWLELFPDEPDQALLQLGSPASDELEPPGRCQRPLHLRPGRRGAPGTKRIAQGAN